MRSSLSINAGRASEREAKEELNPDVMK